MYADFFLNMTCFKTCTLEIEMLAGNCSFTKNQSARTAMIIIIYFIIQCHRSVILNYVQAVQDIIDISMNSRDPAA